jgi:hypothetical protein
MGASLPLARILTTNDEDHEKEKTERVAIEVCVLRDLRGKNSAGPARFSQCGTDPTHRAQRFL